MVLEEATIPSGNDSIVPPDDADKYGTEVSTLDSSLPPSSYNIEVDLSQLPKPVPIIGPLIGFSNARLVRSIVTAQLVTKSLAKRPLTKDEADAVTYGIAQTYSTSSWGVVIGGAFGLARCYNTAQDFKFPFMKRGSININFNEFGKWRDARAIRGWHVVRGSLYLALGSLLGHFIGSTYAATLESKRFAENPKLKNLVETMIRNTRNSKSAGNAEGQNQARGNSFGSKTFGDVSIEDSNDPTHTTSDYPQTSSYDASIGSYDDASPTRGFPALGKDTADKHSSWDRVRQQALTGKSSSSDSTSPKSYNQAIGSSGGDKWQRRRQEVPAGGDSFTFSTTDKDKQLAKAEAKKEFEAMLDRERRGENP